MAAVFDDQFNTAGSTSVVGRAPDVNPFTGGFSSWDDNAAFGGATAIVTGGKLTTAAGSPAGSYARPSIGAGGLSYGLPTFIEVTWNWVAPPAPDIAVADAELFGLYFDISAEIFSGARFEVKNNGAGGVSVYDGGAGLINGGVAPLQVPLVPGQSYPGKMVFMDGVQTVEFLGMSFSNDQRFNQSYGLSRIVCFLGRNSSLDFLTVNVAKGPVWTGYQNTFEVV
ncbi:hypothetical protein VLK31_07160 [Variovorax sp. H27-G14]|uniref:hypothetical protein n=1 Tax=Variovorax sp. H27-G14 TaxID=3111914 RepID=UPI0038FC65C0